MIEHFEASRMSKVRSLAESQLGVVSRAQAIELGLSERQIDYRLATGELIRMWPGVYRVQGSAESLHQALMGASLWGGPSTVVSHRAAGALWELTPIEGPPIELTCPSRRRLDGIRIHFSDLESLDRTSVGSIPVTTVCRTLVDLGSVLDEPALADALDAGLRKRLVSIRWLQWRLRQHDCRTKRSARAIRPLVEDRSGQCPGSKFETRFFSLLKQHRLPKPRGQFPIQLSNGIGYVDFAYPDSMIVVECDGYDYHSIKSDWLRDRHRLNDLAKLGWVVFHVTWDRMKRDPEGLMRDLRELIDSRKRSLFHN